MQRHLAENLRTILDWYHAAQHLCDFAKVWHGEDEAARTQWQNEAKEAYSTNKGRGVADLAPCRRWRCRPRRRRGQEELRKLIGYFTNNRHRTDYPTYRRKGWDIGSGPTEAGCRIIGERLKGRACGWVEDGAASRWRYAVSGGKSLGRLLGPATPPRYDLEYHPSKRFCPTSVAASVPPTVSQRGSSGAKAANAQAARNR